jgi:hypothetical protein
MSVLRTIILFVAVGLVAYFLSKIRFKDIKEEFTKAEEGELKSVS